VPGGALTESWRRFLVQTGVVGTPTGAGGVVARGLGGAFWQALVAFSPLAKTDERRIFISFFAARRFCELSLSHVVGSGMIL